MASDVFVCQVGEESVVLAGFVCQKVYKPSDSYTPEWDCKRPFLLSLGYIL